MGQVISAGRAHLRTGPNFSRPLFTFANERPNSLMMLPAAAFQSHRPSITHWRPSISRSGAHVCRCAASAVAAAAEKPIWATPNGVSQPQACLLARKLLLAASFRSHRSRRPAFVNYSMRPRRPKPPKLTGRLRGPDLASRCHRVNRAAASLYPTGARLVATIFHQCGLSRAHQPRPTMNVHKLRFI